MPTLHFDRRTSYFGRHGRGWCGGLDLCYSQISDDSVVLTPLTSRRELSQACRIGLPGESALAVAGALVLETAPVSLFDRNRMLVAADLLEEYGFTEAELLRALGHQRGPESSIGITR